MLRFFTKERKERKQQQEEEEEEKRGTAQLVGNPLSKQY